jgi:thioredoxin 1
MSRRLGVDPSPVHRLPPWEIQMADSKNVLQATDGNFDNDVLKSKELALVDFWAEWCGPCRMLAPTIESLADEYQGKLKVYKMNVDQNPDTPTKYHIRGIPTVILFQGGQVVDQLVGNQPKDAFIQAIQKHLTRTPA